MSTDPWRRPTADDIREMVERARAMASDPALIRTHELINAEAWDELCPEHCAGVTKLGTGCAIYREPICPRWAARRKVQVRAMLRQAGFGARHLDVTIENVPADIRGRVTQYIANVTANLADGYGAVIAGRVGPGKTSCLALLARAALDAGQGVLYWPAPLRVAELARKPTPEGDDELRWAENCDLLMVDEFNQLADAQVWVLHRMQDLINARWSDRKATCIVMNRPVGDPALAPLEQLMDRLTSAGVTMTTMAASQRGGGRNDVH